MILDILIVISTPIIYYILSTEIERLEEENIKLKSENISYKRFLMSFDSSFAEYVRGKENER